MCRFFQQYQTLIVGAVGFAGVIITLLVNARLARAQHERQVEHERTVLRSGLRAELKANAAIYQDRIDVLKAEPAHNGANVPIDIFADVYKSGVVRIGLLSDSQLQSVVTAYLLILQLPDRMKFLANPDARTEPGYIFVSKRNFAALAKMHENYLLKIREAIDALS